MNDLDDWWDKLAAAPEPVRSIMERQWDWTGRPQRNIIESVVELLDMAEGYEHFILLYQQMMEGIKTPSISHHEASQYYRIYMHAKIVAVKEFSAELKEQVFNKDD